MEEESGHKKLAIFGRDVTQIPCFRSSWLYGISGGISTGLIYFLFTSKPRISMHVGFSAMMAITGVYWSFCRYDHYQKTIEMERIKDYVQKRVLVEGTEMEKLHEDVLDKKTEVFNVSHKNKEVV